MNMVLFWRLAGLGAVAASLTLALSVHPVLLMGLIPALALGIAPIENERTYHARDVSDLRLNADYVKVYTAQRDNILRTLETFKFPDTGVLLNKDTPISTLVEALTRVERSLVECHEKGLGARKRILARKMDGWHALVKDGDDVIS